MTLSVVSGFAVTVVGPPEGGHYRYFAPPSVVSGFSRTQSATRGPTLLHKSFTLDAPAEVVATIHATCARCDWGVAGREAAALQIAVDGRYHSHLLLTRGRDEAEYPVLVGRSDRGAHDITVTLDRSNSARRIGAVRVTGIEVRSIGETDPAFEALAHAPVLHARPNTIGRFSDVPLLMWYESAATARGRSYQYSVIFSNEDGGTATDRLMATWGRTTDIELVYTVEVDANGRTLGEEFQGPDHVITPFRGAHDALHPLEFVVTDNNMVSDAGTAAVRYAPAPERFDLTGRSREVVMDAHPWTYRITSQELTREGKVSEGARPGSGRIPDPRRFVFVEACTDLDNAALSFAVRSSGPHGSSRSSGSGGVGGARGPGRSSGSGEVRGEQWYESDRGRAEFRIVRTGCFRGGVPVPRGGAGPDAIRFRAWPRDANARPASVRLTRVNVVFVLGADFLPKPSQFSWTGSLSLATDGAPRELKF